MIPWGGGGYFIILWPFLVLKQGKIMKSDEKKVPQIKLSFKVLSDKSQGTRSISKSQTNGRI